MKLNINPKNVSVNGNSVKYQYTCKISNDTKFADINFVILIQGENYNRHSELKSYQGGGTKDDVVFTDLNCSEWTTQYNVTAYFTHSNGSLSECNVMNASVPDVTVKFFLDLKCNGEIPYSLQFSRLKFFAIFAGCTLTTKILSHEKFSTDIRTQAL